MTLPALFYGFLLATLYGTAYHFWIGGKGWQLLICIILAWAGFWAGHFLGAYLEWTFASLGPINAGLGTLGSLLFLIVGSWLGKMNEG